MAHLAGPSPALRVDVDISFAVPIGRAAFQVRDVAMAICDGCSMDIRQAIQLKLGRDGSTGVPRVDIHTGGWSRIGEKYVR